MRLKEMSAVVVSHVFTTGPAQELESYLVARKMKKFRYIGHPFTFAADIRSFYSVYKDGNKELSHKAYGWRLPGVLGYVKDLLYTLGWLLFSGEKYDLYIGVDNLNAFAGLMLRALGKTDTVFFYTIDYIPKRFDNRLLNRLYHWMDSYCVAHCDYVWNLSPVMIEEREKKGVLAKHSGKQITVPIGTDLNVKRTPFEDIDRYTIAFFGHLRQGQGVDFLIGLLPEVIEKIPKARLLIIGTGPLEKQLKERAEMFGLSNHVRFAGFIEDHTEAQTLLSRCAVGIAPYEDSESTYTRYTDPGKPKAYMAAGLPVVITKVPRIAYEIERKGAGIAIEYDSGDAVRALVSILSDDDRLLEYKKNAIEFAGEFEWPAIFENAFKESGICL